MSDPNPPAAASGLGAGPQLAILIVVAAVMAFAAMRLLHGPGRPPSGDLASAAGGAALPQLFDAPPFQMTDESGKSLSSQDLSGKVWVADFFFTRCQGPCPAMSAEMAALSRRIGGEVRFVSFSVDPKTDTPAVLSEYAGRYDADQARWILLTEPETSYLDLAEGFRVMAKPADGSHPIIHSERFFLVDRRGKVRGSYLWSSREDLDRLAADALTLQAEP